MGFFRLWLVRWFGADNSSPQAKAFFTPEDNQENPMSDLNNLQRFVDAQAGVWDDVKAELLAGRKTTHWMWFIFPQLAALGRSGTAKFYGITGAEEARAYIVHPVLGQRLVECCDLLMQVKKDVSAREVFGDVDAMKLRSCLAPVPCPFRQPWSDVVRGGGAGQGGVR